MVGMTHHPRRASRAPTTRTCGKAARSSTRTTARSTRCALKPDRRRQEARGARLHRRRCSAARRPGSASSDDAALPHHEGIPMNRFQVRKVAVLGAGVMGAQIAAHLVNVQGAGHAVRPACQGRAEERHRHEGRREPEEAQARAARRRRRRRADRAGQLRGAPRPAARTATSSSRRSPSAWTGSSTCTKASRRPSRRTRSSRRNTSGLSITKLSEVLPEEIKPRFCGIHFFNPPRYMALVELIDTPTTQPEDPRPARGLRDHRARQGRRARARTRRTSSPTASASPACWRR